MSKDPVTLARGIILGLAWLAWFFAGFAYGQMHGPIKAFLGSMSQQQTAFFACWLLVSISLLYYAVVTIIRGLTGSSNRPRA